MKTSIFLRVTLAALAFKLSLVSGHAAPVAAKKTAVTNAVPKSVFIIPSKKQEGSDPFFPNSTRLWGGGSAARVKQRQPSGLDCLVLKGLSGTQANRLAMINGRTMARNEQAEINTDCGRLLVHCVDITSNSAIIEVSGERRELKLRPDL